MGMALSVLAAAVTAAHAQPLRIYGFDSARGGAFSLPSGAPLSALRAAIENAFPGSTFVGVNVLSLDSVTDADVLVLSSARGNTQAITPLSTDEQTALLSFVMAGGGVVFFAENDTFAGSASGPANQSLVGPFDFHTTGTGPGGPNPADVLPPASHLVVSGPFGSVTVFTVGWTGWLDEIAAAASSLAVARHNQQPVLAAIPCGALGGTSGPVVVFGDSTMIADGFRTPANTVLVLNAVSYAAGLRVRTQPESMSTCPAGSATFSVTATGAESVTYQWQIQLTSGTWATLANDPMPLTCPGGANGFAYATPLNSPTVNITVRSCPGVQHWRIRCLVSGMCGSVVSDEVTLTICPADFNCDGSANSQDFFDFLSAFFAGEPSADFNADGAVNSQDFFDFVAGFFAGC